VKAQSIKGLRVVEVTCDSCLYTREEGVSAARSIVCFPPQQKPAAPILRLSVSNGGGEVRRAFTKEKTRGWVTACRDLYTQGRAKYIACMTYRGFQTNALSHDPGSMILSMRGRTPASKDFPIEGLENHLGTEGSITIHKIRSIYQESTTLCVMVT